MSNTPQGAPASPEVVNRRLHVRQLVPALTYIDLGRNNGGIGLDIGEGGLSVTSAAPLYTDGLSQMRFELPGSSDRLEVSGEIAWISESKRNAGLRFVDISEKARDQIRDWISSQESPRQSEVGAPEVVSEKPKFARTLPTLRIKSVAETDDGAHEHFHKAPSVTKDVTPETLGRPDRRVGARQPIPSLVYVDLGQNNGGIGLNIGEGGLAVTSAAPLDADGMAQMRFQLPGSSDRLEVNGEIVWIGESNRKAGLRFLDLPENVRDQIRNWILSESSEVAFQSEGANRERAWRRLEMTTIRMPSSELPQSEATADRTDRLPSGMQATSTLNAAPALVEPMASQAIDVEDVYLAEARAKKRTRLLMVAALVLGVSFLVGVMTSGPGSRILGWFGRTESRTLEVPSSAVGIPSPSAQNAYPSPDQSEALPASDNTASAPAKADANSLGLPPVPAHPKALALNSGAASATPNTGRSQADKSVASVLGSASPQPQATSAAVPTSPSASQTDVAASSGATGQENLPSVKPAENPEALTGSVSVNFGLFPSLRVPAELKSQGSPQGTSLHIGRLLSRVDPVYPQEAITQKLEGIVKLHAVIGRDGTIQSVELRGGPDLLVTAATNAVRQWRFTESSVGNQLVEAEEDITIAFRLAGPAVHAN